MLQLKSICSKSYNEKRYAAFHDPSSQNGLCGLTISHFVPIYRRRRIQIAAMSLRHNDRATLWYVSSVLFLVRPAFPRKGDALQERQPLHEDAAWFRACLRSVARSVPVLQNALKKDAQDG